MKIGANEEFAKKVERNFFPKDLLILMEQNPMFYFGSNN